jgi:hypothetical protein
VSTDFVYRDGCRFRAGLTYEPDTVHAWGVESGCGGGEPIWHFYPDGPFFVDGIRYEHPLNSAVIHARPMIEVFHDASGQPARHCPEPLTDAQLDRWVQRGGGL